MKKMIKISLVAALTALFLMGAGCANQGGTPNEGTAEGTTEESGTAE